MAQFGQIVAALAQGKSNA